MSAQDRLKELLNKSKNTREQNQASYAQAKQEQTASSEQPANRTSAQQRLAAMMQTGSRPREYNTKLYEAALNSVRQENVNRKTVQPALNILPSVGSHTAYYGKGNIDLNNRPVVQNEDGSVSTVESMSINVDGKEVLIPTIVNGKKVSDDEAIAHYFESGEYLGIFDSVEEADAYAEQLHIDQERLYAPNTPAMRTSTANDGSADYRLAMSRFDMTRQSPGLVEQANAKQAESDAVMSGISLSDYMHMPGTELQAKRAQQTALSDEAKQLLWQAAQSEQRENATLAAAKVGPENLNEMLDHYNLLKETVMSDPGVSQELIASENRLKQLGLTEAQVLELAAWRKTQQNAETAQMLQEETAQLAQEHPVLSSALSVPMNLASGVGAVDLALQYLINKASGRNAELDYNTGAQILGQTSSAIRGTVTDSIDSELGKFLYQTGMSMADSGSMALLGAVGVPGTTLLLGGSAATQTAQNAKARGLSDEQALLLALTAGAAEAIFEKVSLDKLLSTGAVEGTVKQKILQTLKNIGIQATTEGSEEVFTTIANTIADAVITGDKSEYQQMVQAYLVQGFSQDDAEKKASVEWLKGLALDFAGGALSGGIMGGGVSALSAVAGSDAQVDPEVVAELAEKIQNMQMPNEMQAAPTAQVTQATPTNLEAAAMQAVREDAAEREAEAKRAEQLGATLGEAGSRAFAKTLDGSLSAQEAFDGFRALYNASLTGSEMTESQKQAAAKLPEAMSHAALVSAQQDANKARNAKYFGLDADAIVRDEAFKKAHLSSKTVRSLEGVARVTKTQIQFYENLKDKDGNEINASYENGVIKVSLKSDNPVLTAVAHEVVHRIREISPDTYETLANYVSNHMDSLWAAFKTEQLSVGYSTNDVDTLSEELVADAFGALASSSDVLQRFAVENPGAAQKIADVFRDLVNAVKRILNNQNIQLSKEERTVFKELLAEYEKSASVFEAAIQRAGDTASLAGELSAETESRIAASRPVSAVDEVKNSRKHDTKYMDAAEKKNNGRISLAVMRQAREARQAIADIFNDPDLADALGLPPDIIGNTYIPNGSYSGTEENTTVCIRSIAADALMDAVAEYLGRPLTVEDTVTISQELFRFTDKPECLYCYVAMDRKAYREFLGSYLKQRDAALENIRNGMSKEEAYEKFRDGRKDTDPMRDRFNMWVANQGKSMITANDLASYANMEKAMERDKSLTPQINDALKYAQSASWAKKRMSYAAYNNHILRWTQSRIDNLNSNYGLRMYSFSDFSPAFILENMQMITDAAVRGLKVLAYTKELDFVRIFAKSGMNINISVFGYNDGNGGVAQDGMQGADWAPAQELRNQYGNVGITFVATNDKQVEWALDQDWIDVVIPFHLVRTGKKVASYFGWTDYTSMSSDLKTKQFNKETDKAHILPPDHQNDKQMYLDACEQNHLKPRFEKWVDHPNYMKLVNETRRSEGATPTVQPIFDVDAAKQSIDDMIAKGGYYKPIGGDEENMRDIAEEIGEGIKKTAPDGGVKYSVKRTSKMPLSDQLRMFYDNKLASSDALYFGDTPESLSIAGLDALPLAFTVTDFRKSAKGKHNVPRRVWKNLHDSLKRALFAFRAGDRVGIVTGDIDGDGKPILVGVERNATMDRSPVNAIRSVYGLDNPGPWLQNQFKSGKEYIPLDKNRADAFLQTYSAYLATVGEDIRSLDGTVAQDASTVKQEKQSRKSDYETELEALREKYGVIEPGEKATRESNVPRQTSDNDRVSQTIRTVIEAGVTPDEILPKIDELIAKGQFSYEVYTDEDAIARARATIEKEDWTRTYKEWGSRAKRGIVNKADTALGWELYNAAVTDRKTQVALDILDTIIGRQRNAAQALQATRILKTLSPEAQLYGAQRSVVSLQEELTKKYGKKAPSLKIDEDLARAFLEAKTDEARATAMRRLYQDIGRQMPSNFMDKWNAWRYLAMLGNPRTHVRNVLGNALFAPVVATKNLTATAIEKVVYGISNGQMERTKALIGTDKVSKGLLKAAYDDYAANQELIMSGGKYSDAALRNQYIQDGRQIFKFKPLEKSRKGNSNLMELEDSWFSKPHYAYALASYCKASGISSQTLATDRSKLTKAQRDKIDKARAYAIREAQKATYRDSNALSEALASLGKYSGDNKVMKGASMVVEGILPFRKTPANILARGIEYSPLGFMNGLYKAIFEVHKGKTTAAEAIDSISAGLTGTGLMALGGFLAAQGVVRGLGSGDEDEREFDELQGHQTYALEIGDKSFTLDWMAPEALPFFVGVNLYEQTLKENESVTMAAILEAMSTVSDPMLSMSCLQSLNDVFDAVGYATSEGLEALPSALASSVTSYLTQGIPTLLGQIERTSQADRMTTYTEKNSFLTGDMQYAIGKVSSRLPGWDYNQIPYIDAWGRTETTDSALVRGLNNMINPAYSSVIVESEMEAELERLYDVTSDATVFPSRAKKYFNVDKERVDLTAEQYVKYATVKGQNSYNLVNEVMATAFYKSAGDTDKAELISMVYEYANALAKTTVSDYKLDGWHAKAHEAKSYGVSLPMYLQFRAIADADGNDSVSQEEAAQAIEKLGISNRQAKAKLWQSCNPQWSEKNNPFK